LQREVSIDEAREMLFMPDSRAMNLYPRLLQGASNANSSNDDQPAEVKAATPFLSMLFLYHTHTWESAKAFILAQGLLALPPLLLCENLYLRGQAMEIIQNLTNEELHDWFKDPREAGRDELPELSLHRQMLGLMRTKLVPNLVANALPPSEEAAAQAGGASGITFMSLRLLAFWLSWVRHRCVKDFGTMVLSKSLLDTIKNWGGPNAHEEEVALRTQIYDDFIRFGENANEGSWGIGIGFTPECAVGVKERGNTAFKAGRNLMAVSHYSMAMDLDPSDASLYANRAAALLKWATSTKGIEMEEQQGHLQQVVMDCQQATSLRPDYTKAYYRHAQAHIELNQLSKACEVLGAGVRACSDKDDSLAKLRAEVIEKMPAAERPAVSEVVAEEEDCDLLDVE